MPSVILKLLIVPQNVARWRSAAGKVKKKGGGGEREKEGFGIVASEVILKWTD